MICALEELPRNTGQGEPGCLTIAKISAGMAFGMRSWEFCLWRLPVAVVLVRQRHHAPCTLDRNSRVSVSHTFPELRHGR